MSSQHSHVAHRLRICSLLVLMCISARYEKSPNFSSISSVAPGLQLFEVGISRGKGLFLATIFTIPVHIHLSLNFHRVVQFV